MIESVSTFDEKEPIYIDANIFLTLLRKKEGWEQCQQFLRRVEYGSIRGIISPLVMDEVVFNLIMDELMLFFQKESERITYTEILAKVKEDPSLLEATFPKLTAFMIFIEEMKGLTFIPCPELLSLRIFKIIMAEKLLPRDALHYGIMAANNIVNIATTDKDFERIERIKVYMPFSP